MSFEKFLSRRRNVRTIETTINRKVIEDLIASHLYAITVIHDDEDADIVLPSLPKGSGVPIHIKIKTKKGGLRTIKDG
jgi:hypothetical protein